MKPAFLLAFSSFAVAANFHSLQNATLIAEEFAQIPKCGLACLAVTVPALGCTLSNATCQCSSSQLVTTTAKCMLAKCTFAEAIEVSKIQAAICQFPFESRNKEMRFMTIICAAITYTALLFRFSSRVLLAQTFGMDDWVIIAAAASDAVFTYYGVLLGHDGFGNHLRDVNVTFIPQLLFSFYICEFLYLLTIGLVKISILFFYLRVFPKKSFRLLCWLMIGFCTSSALAFVLVTIFQCRPVSFAWDKTSGGSGKCVNYNTAAWANAGVNIMQDILIVALPMKELRALQLGRMKKMGVYTMFGVGGFVCITSIIRLSSLQDFGFTTDATWDNIPATLLSTIETTAAILCACLPAIRAGIATLFPTILKTTLQKSYFSSTNSIRVQTTILVSHQPSSDLKSRISGIDLSPTFSAWKVLESAFGPRSPGIGQRRGDNLDPAPGRRSPFPVSLKLPKR